MLSWRRFSVSEGDDRQTYLVFAPDGTLLAVGSADKTIRLWSIASPARPVQVGAPLTGPAGYV